MTVVTATGTVAAYATALTHLRAALEGVTLTAGGAVVTVLDSPPVSANVLPVAWVEAVRGGTSPTRNVNRVTLRYVVVPDPAENDLLELICLAAVDAIDAEKWAAPFEWQRAQVELGGVTRDAVFIATAIDYPAVC